MKKRGAGGLLDVLKGQHLDAGVSLARRVGILLARFSRIGSTNSDPQIVTGTIGRLANAFLMQLVGSPSVRPTGGHLWAIGAVPSLYNGDGTATPILDAWADPDNDVAALTVDVGTQSVSAGDYGLVVRATKDDAQELLFFRGGGGGGVGGDWNYYGDGFLGSLTAPTDTTSWAGFAASFLTSGGNGTPYGIADGTYVHVPVAQELFFQDLTIPSGVIVVGGLLGATAVKCPGTLTVNGELSCSGDHIAFAKEVMGLTVGNGVAGGAGSSGASNGTSAISKDTTTIPIDEGEGRVVNTSKNSGKGGSAGGFSGGNGGGSGYVPIQPGDGGRGDLSGSSPWMNRLPGAAFGCDWGGSFFSGGGFSGGGGAAGVGGAGGRGGFGGQLLIVAAKVIAGSGKLSADGGRGLAAPAANGGGGGGGNPGGLDVISDTLPTITVSYAAGNGGAGAGTGAAGANAGGTGRIDYFIRS